MTRKFNIEPDWSIEDCHVAALLAMTWGQPDGHRNDVKKERAAEAAQMNEVKKRDSRQVVYRFPVGD